MLTLNASCREQMLDSFAGMVRGMTFQWGPNLPAQLVARLAQQGMLPDQAPSVLRAAEPEQAQALEAPANGEPLALPEPGLGDAASPQPDSSLLAEGARLTCMRPLRPCIFICCRCTPYLFVVSLDHAVPRSSVISAVPQGYIAGLMAVPSLAQRMHLLGKKRRRAALQQSSWKVLRPTSSSSQTALPPACTSRARSWRR